MNPLSPLPPRGNRLPSRRLAAQDIWAEAVPVRLSHAAEGVTLVDSNNTIVYDSPSMALLGGYPRGARHGQLVSAYSHPDDWPKLSEALDLLRQGHTTNVAITARWLTHDRAWRWLESLASVNDPQDGTLVLSSRDITPQVQRTMRWKAVLDAGRQLTVQLPDRFWPALLQAAFEIVDADAASVQQWDSSSRELVIVQSTPGPTQAVPRIPLGAGASGLAVARGAPVVVNDYQRSACAISTCRDAGAQAVAAVPLQYMGVVLGAICLVRYASDRPFVPDEIEGLAALSGIAAGVLLGQARGRLQEASPALDELRRELTLVIGYLEVLAGDSESPSTETYPVVPPRHMASQALKAAWRAVRALGSLRV